MRHGNYLVPLARTYEFEGFDRNEPMLEIARRKLPAARLWCADKPGDMVVQTWDGVKAKPPEAMRLVRAVTHLPEGRRSRFEFHWLVVTPRGVEHFRDRHVLWQHAPEELLAAFRGAGFEASWLDPGPVTGRGALLLRRAGPRSGPGGP